MTGMPRVGFAEAVALQPTTLATTLASVRAALPALPDAVRRPGAVPGIVAMGASTNAAAALVACAARSGRLVLNLAASEVGVRPPADWWLAISESGRSPEPIAALRGASPVVALTNVPGSPVTEGADATVSLGRVPDAGVYATGYTSTLVALGLLGEAMGLPDAAAGLDEVPDLVAALLAEPPDAIAALERSEPLFVDAVGGQESFAAAAEAALLLREAARLPTAAHLPAQYLHGPVESLDPRGMLLLFGPDADGLLARFADTVPTLHVTGPGPAAAGVVRLPAAAPLTTAVLQGVVAQLLTLALGGRGWEIGSFRHEFPGTKLPG